jgi:stage II sporulation protein D
MLKLVALIICSVALAQLPASAACSPRSARPVVRVAVSTGATAVTVSLHGSYRVTDAVTGALIRSGRGLPPTPAGAGQRGLRLGEQTVPSRMIRLEASRGFTLHGGTAPRRYRGGLDIVLDDAGRVTAVNRIDLEAYVSGVLYHEVSDTWPMEALKAQAVAARTYALYQVRKKKPAAYDVTSDVFSQVYGGRSAERPRTNRAVRRTRGQVLLYQGGILPAFFHASCGGHTEDVAELWRYDLAPLRGVGCPHCDGRPGYSWKRNFHSQAVQELLGRHGYVLGPIHTISVQQRNASGRVVELRITDRNGGAVTISGKDFRAILGPNVVRSNRYRVVMQGYYFDLVGQGWGHGVGMCQQGACGMALAGGRYRDILGLYYPGAVVSRVY